MPVVFNIKVTTLIHGTVLDLPDLDPGRNYEDNPEKYSNGIIYNKHNEQILAATRSLWIVTAEV